MVVDRQGKSRVLTGSFSDVRGLAWAPSGKEIWFTGSNVHLSSNLFAVDLNGHQRLVWAGAGGVVLQDIFPDGRVLFIRENRRRGIAGLFPGHDSEIDMSWQDWSLVTRISPDGKWIFFSEEGDGGGQKYSAYMRATDGSPAIRLGDGAPYGVSPDLKWVASIIPGQPQQLWLLPTRAGDAEESLTAWIRLRLCRLVSRWQALTRHRKGARKAVAVLSDHNGWRHTHSSYT